MSNDNDESESLMQGTYKNHQIWVPFADETRKFYERSYYGKLYNTDKKEIIYDFQMIEEDEDSDGMVIMDKSKIPQDRTPEYIVFHPLEAQYLIEREKLIVKTEENHSVSFNELIELSMDVDPKFWQKYIVYRDIRHRGYIIRVGYGGKADFRVYQRGARFGKDSAKFVYFIIQDGIPVALNDLDAVVKQVIGNRKKLILAIFDKLGDSTFYRLEDFEFRSIGTFDEKWNIPAEFKPHN